MSEVGFKANDVNALQSVSLNGASGGTYSLSLEGESTSASGDGNLTGPAVGNGSSIEGSNTLTGVSAGSGEFIAGEQIFGVGIPSGTTIVSVHGSTIVLSAEATASGSAVTLSAESDEVAGLKTGTGTFAAGEQLTGAGIPAGTTITRVGSGTLTLSAPITASGTSVALSAALAYNASASQVQSALEGLPMVGPGNVAVSGAEGGPYAIEFVGALAHSAVAALSADGSGLTPGGAGVTATLTRQGGDGWGTAVSQACEKPSAMEVIKNDEYQPVHAAIAGLEAGAIYRYRLSSTVAGTLGGTEYGAPQYFTAVAIPRVSATSANGVTSSFALLSAVVDPRGSATTYQFQYLSEAQFKADGESFAGAATAPVSPAAVGSGGEAGTLAEAVSQQISGLTPDTAYRFRVIATNEAGASEGETAEGGGEILHRFTTQAVVSPALPDGRAYELITPPNKQGAEDMFGEPMFVCQCGPSYDRGASSESGNQFMLVTRSAFGPFPASGKNVYVFSRHASAGTGSAEWSFTSLASPTRGIQNAKEAVIEPANFSQVAFQDDVGQLTSEVGTAHEELLGPPGGPYNTLHADRYNHEEDAGDSFRFPEETTEVVGGSSALGIVVLNSNNPALAEGVRCEGIDSNNHSEHNACSPPIYNVFKSAGGELEPLNVNEEGEPISSCGSALGRASHGGGINTAAGAVSADGSKIFITAPLPRGIADFELEGSGFKGCPPEKPSEIYMRVGSETVPVSMPEPGAPETRAHYEAHYIAAAQDGSRVFFTSEGELTANDQGIHDEELYEYDTETRKLTRISAAQAGNAPGSVLLRVEPFRVGGDSSSGVTVSPDGSHVYFVAQGVLTGANAEGKSPGAGRDNLYVYDTETGHMAFITQSEGEKGIMSDELQSGEGGSPASGEATPDGRLLLFEDGAGLPLGVAELYRYDAQSESLECITCGSSSGYFSPPSLVESNQGLSAHSISADGSYVFFNTSIALVPQDTNGTLDVYEWHEGTISLLSSGTDLTNSYFVGASADGANVFFATHARLVPQAGDNEGNVYDARVCTSTDPCIAPPVGSRRPMRRRRLLAPSPTSK